MPFGRCLTPASGRRRPVSPGGAGKPSQSFLRFRLFPSLSVIHRGSARNWRKRRTQIRGQLRTIWSTVLPCHGIWCESGGQEVSNRDRGKPLGSSPPTPPCIPEGDAMSTFGEDLIQSLQEAAAQAQGNGPTNIHSPVTGRAGCRAGQSHTGANGVADGHESFRISDIGVGNPAGQRPRRVAPACD